MTQILLFDVAPDPVSTGVSVAGIVLIFVVVLMFVGAGLTGFVFLIRRLTKGGAGTRVMVGDACLNLDALPFRSNRATSPPSHSVAQPENSPNQP